MVSTLPTIYGGTHISLRCYVTDARQTAHVMVMSWKSRNTRKARKEQGSKAKLQVASERSTAKRANANIAANLAVSAKCGL